MTVDQIEILVSQSRYEMAYDQLQEFLSSDPMNYQGLNLMAVSCINLDKYDEANLANLEIARLEQEKVLLNYNKTLLIALVEVSDALHDYYSADDVLRADERLVAASREYLRLARLQYGNGVLNYLDVLDAQRQLFDAELSLSDAQSKKLKAVVQLYKALGGGWQA